MVDKALNSFLLLKWKIKDSCYVVVQFLSLIAVKKSKLM